MLAAVFDDEAHQPESTIGRECRQVLRCLELPHFAEPQQPETCLVHDRCRRRRLQASAEKIGRPFGRLNLRQGLDRGPRHGFARVVGQREQRGSDTILGQKGLRHPNRRDVLSFRAPPLIDDSRSPAGPESDSSAEKYAGRGSVFGKAPASSRLGIDTAVTAMYVRRLEEMVRACQNDERRLLTDVLQVQASESGGVIHPLQLLLSLDHGDPRYKAHLAGIAAAFPESETTGYISNRQARLIPSMMKQISRYRGIATEYDGRPAAAEALFHLATACQEESILDEAKATLEELVRRYPESCWSDQARRSLASLTMLDLGSE